MYTKMVNKQNTTFGGLAHIFSVILVLVQKDGDIVLRCNILDTRQEYA
jgi:hypothetical protein